MIKTIYFDLDGVLADYDGYYRYLFGGSRAEHGEEESRIKIRSINNWYEKLPLMNDGLKVWNFINQRHSDVRILTASGRDNPAAGLQKIRWCADKLSIPSTEVFVVSHSEEKAKFASEGMILIDDTLERSILPWVNAGGIGIHHIDSETTIDKLRKCLI